MSGAVVVVGAQWGDEGKGKIVDLFTASAEVVVRYAGGPNAGHTLVVGGKKIVLRLIPSGALHPEAELVMGQGMVIDLSVLGGEIDALGERGLDMAGRLALSDRAHLVLAHHRVVDGLREERALGEAKIGTTKRGIGPCYEDKAARRGLRAGDLRDLGVARDKVSRALEAWSPTIVALGGEVPRVSDVVGELEALAPRFLPLLVDTSKRVDERLRAGRRVLFEGAQGTLLDLDHGTYPFVTSSTAIAAGACTGVGVGPSRIGRVVGISKAYVTRVGAGPFPTELFDETGELIRKKGGEFGSVTGRPRRTGWLDLPGLRYAARVNGLDALALTKLDVLAGLPHVEVCTAYEVDGERTDDLPVDRLERARPVLERLPSWDASIERARAMAELPSAARAFVSRVEAAVGVPVEIVSVGPGREETITLRAPF
jgi:adenylosuccinate synthase